MTSTLHRKLEIFVKRLLKLGILAFSQIRNHLFSNYFVFILKWLRNRKQAQKFILTLPERVRSFRICPPFIFFLMSSLYCLFQMSSALSPAALMTAAISLFMLH